MGTKPISLTLLLLTAGVLAALLFDGRNEWRLRFWVVDNILLLVPDDFCIDLLIVDLCCGIALVENNSRDGSDDFLFEGVL